MWTKAEIDRACDEARAFGETAHVVNRGGRLVAVVTPAEGDTVIVRDIAQDILTSEQLGALARCITAISPMRRAFQTLWEEMSRKPGGKPWSADERRQLVEFVAKNWRSLDRRLI